MSRRHRGVVGLGQRARPRRPELPALIATTPGPHRADMTRRPEDSPYRRGRLGSTKVAPTPDHSAATAATTPACNQISFHRAPVLDQPSPPRRPGHAGPRAPPPPRPSTSAPNRYIDTPSTAPTARSPPARDGPIPVDGRPVCHTAGPPPRRRALTLAHRSVASACTGFSVVHVEHMGAPPAVGPANRAMEQKGYRDGVCVYTDPATFVPPPGRPAATRVTQHRGHTMAHRAAAQVPGGRPSRAQRVVLVVATSLVTSRFAGLRTVAVPALPSVPACRMRVG